jgi:hypothetical protein
MWKTIATILPGICLFLATAALGGDKTEQEYATPLTVEAKGKLQIPEAVLPEGVPDGVSGMYVLVKGKAYWLAFGKDKEGQELQKLAAKLKDKAVIVTGKLEMRRILLPPGKEVPVIVVTGLKAAAGDVNPYLTADGKLKAKLTLSIGKNRGIVGSADATTWVIEPSGAWTMKTTFKEATAKGQLTAAQLAALAQHLKTQDFNNLPPQLGVLPYPDNTLPYVAISFGKKGTVFFGSLTPAMPTEGFELTDEWSRFVSLALVLQNYLQTNVANGNVELK